MLPGLLHSVGPQAPGAADRFATEGLRARSQPRLPTSREAVVSVEDPQLVDSIGLVDEGARVRLSINDPLPWGDESHLLRLQDKINAYLAFIESGEIYESYPDARHRSLQIHVVCTHAPDAMGLRFLSLAGEVIARAGFALSHEVS